MGRQCKLGESGGKASEGARQGDYQSNGVRSKGEGEETHGYYAVGDQVDGDPN